MHVLGVVLLTAYLATVSNGRVIVRNGSFVGSSVLDEVPLIDGHNDFPFQLYNREQNVLSNFSFNSNLLENPDWSWRTHTDLPRMRAGKMGGQFWAAYVGCAANNKDAVQLTLDQIDVIKRLVALNPNDLQFVTTADGIWDAFNEGKIASLIGVEGGHSIDSRLSVLRLFYELGVRYLTLTHNCNLPWVDHHLMDSPQNENANKIGGLSTWGQNLILEMNRLGMLVDLAHVSKPVMVDALRVSLAPIIFSHSSAWEEHRHTRNVPDDVLELVRANNGIVMVNFYTGFITSESSSSIEDVIRHLEHIRRVIGSDHIGLGADYDGVPSVPVGLEDVSKYPALFDALGDRGWSREELQNLAGLNIIRVLRDVEAVRDSLAANIPYDLPIPHEDLVATNESFDCRSNFPRV